MTDTDALHKYATQGDPAAFEQLVRAHQGLVYAACCRHLKQASDVEDAVQETFLKLARQARTIRTNIAAWLHRCAVNTAIDLGRRGAMRRRHEAGAAHMRPDSAEPVWPEIEIKLDEALLSLDDEQRRLIVEHYLEGRTQVELAGELGITPVIVNRRVHAALSELRSLLANKGLGVGVAALATGLTATAAQATTPAALTQSLLKIGVTGTGAAATVGGSTVAIGAFAATKATLMAIGVAAVLVVGGTVWVATQLIGKGPTPPITSSSTGSGSSKQSGGAVVVVGDPDAPYEKIYRLEDEDIRLVTLPFIKDRQRLYERMVGPTQVESMPQAAQRMTFHWKQDGQLTSGTMGFGGMGPVWKWSDIVGYILNKKWYEVQIAGVDIEKFTLKGDWVVRDQIDDTRLFASMSSLLKQAAGMEVHFEKTKTARKVVIVGGKFQAHPSGPQNRDPKNVLTVYLYATDAVPANCTRVGGSSDGVLDPRVGQRLQIPIMIDTHFAQPFIELYADPNLKLDPHSPDYIPTLERVLANLKTQTGLDYNIETRDLEVWKGVPAR